MLLKLLTDQSYIQYALYLLTIFHWQIRIPSGCMNSALMMFIVIGGIGGLANAFVNNYALFCVCRFVAAMGQSIWILSNIHVENN